MHQEMAFFWFFTPPWSMAFTAAGTVLNVQEHENKYDKIPAIL